MNVPGTSRATVSSPEAAPRQSACNARTRNRYAVLVVDDAEAARYATARTLKQAGFHVVEAAGGAQALQLGAYVSAVVLDVQLPDVNGMEVCRLLRNRADTSRLAIVHASALHRDAEDEETSKAAGADAYLVMPIDPAVLVTAVEQAINLHTPEG